MNCGQAGSQLAKPGHFTQVVRRASRGFTVSEIENLGRVLSVMAIFHQFDPELRPRSSLCESATGG
jgi:hypothetical protein